MRLLVFGLAAAAAAGCGEGVVPVSTSRDSLGITIVGSTAPSWAEGAGWRIEEEPVVGLTETGSGDQLPIARWAST